MKKLSDKKRKAIDQAYMMGARIGIIATEISRRTGQKPMEALRNFYKSETCRRLHEQVLDESEDFYDMAIIEEYFEEINNKKESQTARHLARFIKLNAAP